ncbi:MAG TPA: DUF2190 family protein [Bauldia sp.]|nr:DUF2190 family protein [Bauldia sp.]
MKNYIQPGKFITITAPTGGLLSGQGVLIGSLFGIATGDAAEGEEVEVLTEEVVEIGKTAALQIDVGDRVFWDPTNKIVNKTATGQVCVGVAVTAAANPSDTVRVKLGATTPAGT